MAEKTIREKCEQRFAGMVSVRKPYEPDWQEINRLFLPSRSEILSAVSRTTGTPNRVTRRANMATYSSKGRRAARIASAGMDSGMSSSSNPWFKLRSPWPDLDEYQPVKEWLAIVEQLIYDFLASTNFYNASKVGYSELVCYGTECGIMLEHDTYGAVSHTLTAGEYWIANDSGLMADTLYRKANMTVSQVVESFVKRGGWGVVSTAVKNAYDKSNYQDIVPICHAIEPNTLRDPTKMDARNKEYRSIWWEEGQSKKSVLLREGGFDEKPFWCPRWIDIGGEMTYGDGPGYDALPDGRELQLASKRRGRNVDILNRPPMGVPTNMANSYLTLDPGTLAYGSPTDLQAIKPLFNVDYRAVETIREEVREHQADVMECFYADLFFAITEMEGVQPRNTEELFMRNEEKLTQLGPVVDRVNVEKLEVVVDRAFSILLKYGQLPPAPQELQGQPLRVTFVSVLARAQKASVLGDIQRQAQFVGFLAGIYPDVTDKFDADAAVDAFATGAGTPPKIIRTDEVVAKLREERAAQVRQQQMMEQMPAMRDGAEAAELLSRTNIDGQNMLERAAA